MKKTLKEIASLIGGELSGSPKISVTGAASIEDAGPNDITFATDEHALTGLASSKAAAVITPLSMKRSPTISYIMVNNIRLAMSKVLALFETKKRFSPGIHKSATVAKSAKIGSGVTIMSGVFIGEGSVIGDKTVVYPNCYIGDGCRVGAECILYPNVMLYDRTLVGGRCVLHAGVVVGVDGFGFVPVDGKHMKIPQIGNVMIEDDVEIFANTCVSRATMGSTIIKRGTKIDNVTHIAHNCKIGQDCAITALVAIAGSSELKDHVSVGGTVGINDHIVIGENTVVMGRAGVTKDVPPNSVISGFPAQDHKKELQQQADIRRLPKLYEKVTEIEKQIKK